MVSLSCVLRFFVAVLPEKASCLVVASCVSFVSPQAAKLTRSATPPLPTKPCDFAGTPTMAACFSVGTQMRCFALNTLLSLRCTLQGLGKSVVPIGASIVEMIWKIVTVVAVIPVCGYFGVCISEPIIWTASGLLVAVIAIKTLRAFEKA